MDSSLDLSGINIDKYHVVEKIGNGSFGSVYNVIDMVLNTKKAIKILDISEPEKVLALFKEAEIPYKCQHKNIVMINEANVFSVNNELKVIIDMELVNGGSLEKRLKERFIPVVEGLKILSDALYGLEYAHLKGIVHRDIKPANILLHNDIPKISDFGLAVPNGTNIDPWVWYVTHAAPEVFENSVASIESDIFAFGMTLFRVVNNISDWRTYISQIKNYNILIRNGKLIEHLPFSPYVPSRVKQIIKKACKASPYDRYKSAAEFRDAIDRLRFYCKWYPVDSNTWEGLSCGSKDKYIARINFGKKSEFVLKKNNRCIGSECETFSTKEEAQAFLYQFIAQKTIS